MSKRTDNSGPLGITIFGLIAGVLLLGLAYVITTLSDITLQGVTADPAATAGFHPFTGIISNIGALLWCTALVSCLFAFMLKLRIETGTDFLLISSAALTLMLLIDDMFMMHEFVLPFNVHIEQNTVYAAYAVPVLSYLFYFRKELTSFEPYVLISAFTFLGSSVLGDQVLPQEGIAYFIEDALKFVGIILWTIYFVRLSLHKCEILNSDYADSIK